MSLLGMRCERIRFACKPTPLREYKAKAIFDIQVVGPGSP